MSMDKATIVEVVTELLGPLEPVGESHTDERRLRNLDKATYLVETLTHEIAVVGERATRREASMAKAGRRARAALIELRDSLIEEFPI